MRGQIRKSYHTWFKTRSDTAGPELQALLGQLIKWLDHNSLIRVTSISFSGVDFIDVYYERDDETWGVVIANSEENSIKGTS